MDLKEVAKRSEEEARRVFEKLAPLAKEAKRIAVLYTGKARGLAKHVSTVLTLSKPEIGVLLYSLDYAYTTLLPYIADRVDLVLAISTEAHGAAVGRIAGCSRLLGLKVAVVSPPLPQQLRDYMHQSEIEILELEKSILRLSMLLASLMIGVELGKDVSRMRRLENELSVVEVVEDLVDRYRQDLEALKARPMIFYSESMETVGEELSERGLLALPIDELISRASEVNEKSLLLIYASYEDQLVNEKMVKLALSGAKVSSRRLRINTDPLTAPVYGVLLTIAALGLQQ